MYGTSVFAGDMPSLMLMGADSDKDTIPRGSRPFNEVMDNFINILREEGFDDVYNETASVDDADDADSSRRRPLKQLLFAARQSNADPDVIVLFKIYWDLRDRGYARSITGHVSGKLINIKDGRELGTFHKKSKKSKKIRKGCGRECMMEAVSEMATNLSSDVAVVIRQDLEDYQGGGSSDSDGGGPVANFTLILKGLNQDDRDSMEEMIEEFPGTISLKQKSNEENTSRRQAYKLKTKAKTVKLQRNFRKALKKINARGLVDLVGNTITVEKTGKKKRKKEADWD
jgi:hypothetical protein